LELCDELESFVGSKKSASGEEILDFLTLAKCETTPLFAHGKELAKLGCDGINRSPHRTRQLGVFGIFCFPTHLPFSLFSTD